jgi:hypothetical protein
MRALILMVLLQGCQLALDVEAEQCTTDRDCVGLFGRSFVCTDERVCIEEEVADAGMGDSGPAALPPAWACIDEPPPPVAPLDGRPIALTIAAVDFITLRVPAGINGRACNPRDPTCDSPLLENVMPNADGFMVFENLPHGWDGYLIISAPDFVDTMVFSNKRYTMDETPEGPTMLKRRTLEAIAEGGGEMLNPEHGIVLISVRDCLGNAGAGVTLVQEDVDNQENAFYFEGTLPDRDRNETIISTQLTRSQAPLAIAGFSEVPQGYLTVIGIHAASGKEIGRVTVSVRSLTMSIAELHAGY